MPRLGGIHRRRIKEKYFIIAQSPDRTPMHTLIPDARELNGPAVKHRQACSAQPPGPVWEAVELPLAQVPDVNPEATAVMKRVLDGS